MLLGLVLVVAKWPIGDVGIHERAGRTVSRWRVFVPVGPHRSKIEIDPITLIRFLIPHQFD